MTLREKIFWAMMVLTPTIIAVCVAKASLSNITITENKVMIFTILAAIGGALAATFAFIKEDKEESRHYSRQD